MHHTATPTTYTRRLQQLSADRNSRHWTEDTRNRAPHKPLLLLAVIDLIAAGVLAENHIPAELPQLVEAFRRLWLAVMPDARRSTYSLPFFYLAREEEAFWHLAPRAAEEALERARDIRSGSMLTATIAAARLDDALWALLSEPEARATLRRVLVETYFTEELWDALSAPMEEPNA